MTGLCILLVGAFCLLGAVVVWSVVLTNRLIDLHHALSHSPTDDHEDVLITARRAIQALTSKENRT